MTCAGDSAVVRRRISGHKIDLVDRCYNIVSGDDLQHRKDHQGGAKRSGQREIMGLTSLILLCGVFSMTVNITPEDEKLIQEKLRTGAFHSAEEVIHRALVSLPTPEASPQPTRPRRSLVDVLSEPPFAGSELHLERIKDYPRPLDL
jgi:hypothetical protein